MDTLKKSVLDGYQKSLGNVSHVCTTAGISRQTFYNWVDTDSEFAQEVENIKESSVDFVETALFKEIKDGNTACIIFYLKTRAKHRGYIEKSEVENTIKGVKGKYVLPDGTEIEI
jgi:predicted DNA-binding transcriptional regulator AlpA